MCLTNIKKLKKAPRRRKAWKVVCKDRRPLAYTWAVSCGYKKGMVYAKVDIVGRQDALGYHVFTDRMEARHEAYRCRAARLITVEVDPRDWVADGLNNGDTKGAIYRVIRILT